MSEELHVIFGAGPLGQAVMRSLIEKGKQVRMVNQSGKRPADVPLAVEMLGGDAFSTEFTRQAAAGASVVYQCAQPHYWEWRTKYIPLQDSIMEGAAAARAKLIVGDNLYMYGLVQGPIHEGLPHAPVARKGELRAEAALRVLAAHQSGRLRAAIGRASDFYGPLALGSAAGERMFLPAVQGKAAEGLGKIDLPHTYTFISDFGKALAILGEREHALGQVWHVPNAETVSTRRFIEMIFEELDQSPRISVMGKTMLRMAGLFIPAAREMVEMTYEFENPFVVDSSKFVRAFGERATPLEEGIRHSVAWYKAYAASLNKIAPAGGRPASLEEVR